MYLFILIILNFFVYKYLYNTFYKTSDHLKALPKLKEILDEFFKIPGNFVK